MSFNLDGKIRTFQDKHKQKQIMFTNPALNRILKGVIHTEEDGKQSQHERH
jgi:hypothetical protein